MEKRHVDRRLAPDGGRGHRVPRQRRRRRHHRHRRPAGVQRRHRAGLRRHGVARPAGAGPRARTASTRRWSSCRGPTGCSRATSTRRRSPPTGKHVVIIGGGDTGADCLGTSHRQRAASVTQLEILPRPPDDRAERQPVAAVEPRLPHVVGPRGGRRAGVQRQHRALRRRRRRQRQGAADPRGRAGRRPLPEGRGHRARAAGRPRAAGDGLRRAGEGRRGWSASASSSTSAATSQRDDGS